MREVLNYYVVPALRHIDEEEQRDWRQLRATSTTISPTLIVELELVDDEKAVVNVQVQWAADKLLVVTLRGIGKLSWLHKRGGVRYAPGEHLKLCRAYFDAKASYLRDAADPSWALAERH